MGMRMRENKNPPQERNSVRSRQWLQNAPSDSASLRFSGALLARAPLGAMRARRVRLPYSSGYHLNSGGQLQE